MKSVFKSCLVVFLVSCLLTLVSPVSAIYNPLSVPNNKVGIHIISSTAEEASDAASLVNSNGGDFGYVTLLIEGKERNESRWQQVFDDLRRRHLIPLVRLATKPHSSGFWEKPYPGEEQAWADFLDKLNWPTKNRYIIIYNEPNHATEWGNSIDPQGYAQVLDKTIDALKKKSEDFFVLNAGFDSSAPQKPPNYLEQLSYMEQMEQAVPGIFNKLDGWVSHSYPNPAFAGSPDDSGRGTVRNFLWEIQTLKRLGVNKDLPIFIAETGWKHSEGINRQNYPSPEKIGDFYKSAFENAWNNPQIVAITPFLLNYQDPPFDHFSFQKIGSDNPQDRFYPHFFTLQNLPKTSGRPVQEMKALLTKGEIFHSLVSGETYSISLTFKNVGQSIWNDSEQVSLIPDNGAKKLGITEIKIPRDKKIEPNQEFTFDITIKAPDPGIYNGQLNLFEGTKEFPTPPILFATNVKSPVILRVNATLKWKDDFSGSYILKIAGAIGEKLSSISLNEAGSSGELEAKYLLPDYPFDFTLRKAFYKPKTITQTVLTGENTLDFGELQPDIPSAILSPQDLWKILPWSN